MAKQYKNVESTANEVKPFAIDKTRVYVRTNIQRVDIDDANPLLSFHGWKYDEVVYDKDEYIIEQAVKSEENNTILNTLLGVNN